MGTKRKICGALFALAGLRQPPRTRKTTPQVLPADRCLGEPHRQRNRRRIDQRHHRRGYRALARHDAAGPAVAGSGRPDHQHVRRQERRRHDRRPARLRRDGGLQHARSAQRPPADRHRSLRHRFQHDPARQHRAHRNHPRQQRRGALWRRRGRRRHQYRHQDRRGAAAIRARRSRLRLVQPARTQCLRRGIARPVRGFGVRQRGQFGRLSRQRLCAPAQRGRRPALHRRPRAAPGSTYPATTSISVCRARAW